MSILKTIADALSATSDVYDADAEKAKVVLEELSSAGYVIVPKEPTNEMWRAADYQGASEVWGAMIEAAPKP